MLCNPVQLWLKDGPSIRKGTTVHAYRAWHCLQDLPSDTAERCNVAVLQVRETLMSCSALPGVPIKADL